MRIKLFPMTDTPDGERLPIAESCFAAMKEGFDPDPESMRGWGEASIHLSIAQAQFLLAWFWENLPAADRPFPRFDQEAAIACTGVAAVWCPRCGDCACSRNRESGSDAHDDPACPLHGLASRHAEEES